MKYLFLSIAILAGMGCMTSCANADGAALNPVQWVDPYIGTGGHGHTFLGVAAPVRSRPGRPDQYQQGLGLVFGLSLLRLCAYRLQPPPSQRYRMLRQRRPALHALYGRAYV